MMKLLDRFHDASGRPMSFAWMTPSERKAVRAKEHAALESHVFGDADNVMALKLSLDGRAHPTINRFVKLRTNPRVAPLETLAATTKPLSAVVNALRERPRTMRELASVVAEQCGFSSQNARREAFSTISILRACDRVTQRDNFLELA